MQRVGVDDAVDVGAGAVQPAVEAVGRVSHAAALQHGEVLVYHQQVGGGDFVEAQAQLLGVISAGLLRAGGDLPGQAGIVAAVKQDAAGEGEFLPGGVGVVGQRRQHLLLSEFDQLVLGGLHGGRHGRYLHGKGQWVADGQVAVIRTQRDINDTRCHMQAMCHALASLQDLKVAR